ncbi:MAG: RluA family pseudouridine synthase [Spirochaetaceae bacterium]|nr:RluA family pseudouridine synthase [Spirochaetaceae bacterium]
MKKSGSPSSRIPAGAPGHPRTGAENRRAAPPRKGPDREPRGEGRQAGRGEERRADRYDEPKPRAPRGAATLGSRVAFVYEDEDLVAVDKPSGLAVISPEGSRARALYDIVTEHIQARNPKGRAAVVHRIDRDTSGILVFAKNARAKQALMASWDDLVLERRYVALVEGLFSGEAGVFDSWLAENRGGEVYETEPRAPGAKRAVTRWKLLASGNGASLVELDLETGRKHQIRVQLAGAGHPICGDERYGRARDLIGRLGLHAVGLVLTHPFTKKRLELDSAAPPEFAEALREARSPGRPGPRRDEGPAPRGAKEGSPSGRKPGAPRAEAAAAPRAKNPAPPRGTAKPAPRRDKRDSGKPTRE